MYLRVLAWGATPVSRPAEPPEECRDWRMRYLWTRRHGRHIIASLILQHSSWNTCHSSSRLTSKHHGDTTPNSSPSSCTAALPSSQLKQSPTARVARLQSLPPAPNQPAIEVRPLRLHPSQSARLLQIRRAVRCSSVSSEETHFLLCTRAKKKKEENEEGVKRY